MKKITLYLIPALSLFFYSFFTTKDKKETNGLAANNYSINGTIYGLKSDWIYMAHYDTLKKIEKIDSTQVIEGKFKFTGTVNLPKECYIGLKHISKNGVRSGIVFQGQFILDAGDLTISCHKDSIGKLIAKGTPGQDEFYDFKNKSKDFITTNNNLHGKKLAAEKKKDLITLEALKKAKAANDNKLSQIVISHVKLHPASTVSALIVKEYEFGLNEKTLAAAYALFTPEVKHSPYGNFINEKILAGNRTAIGNIAPSFELPEANGKLVALNAYKGKTTLIDFWASWCGPCRAENPGLIEAYRTFKGKGFEIIGVSLDSNKDQWLNAVKEDKLPWMQLSDLKANKSEIKAAYGITSIPMNFLLDENGKIIAKNLSAIDVAQILAKRLN